MKKKSKRSRVKHCPQCGCFMRWFQPAQVQITHYEWRLSDSFRFVEDCLASYAVEVPMSLHQCELCWRIVMPAAAQREYRHQVARLQKNVFAKAEVPSHLHGLGV